MVLVTVLIALFLFLMGRQTMAIFSLVIVVGLLYFHWFSLRYAQQFTAPLGQKVSIVGLVGKVSESGESQRADLQLSDQYQGKIRVTLPLYPEVKYGDVLEFEAGLNAIDGPSQGYFKKEGINATAVFPKNVEIVEHNQGVPIKAGLLAIRDYVQDSFGRVLAPSQATLMTGLVFGKSGGFDKEFSEKLKATGTTHLVALSGYNIAVVINSLFLILGFLINRRQSVWICIIAVVGFVVMTGAESSVVRAAIMAIILVIAERSSRIYSMRNAVVVTAFLMVMINPRILVFDIGFQLSFLALLGIVYLKPAIDTYFRVSSKSSFLGWRENLTTTVAAQLMVLPILFSSFGFFSPLSVITNVLLLSFIPYTMGLGFFIVLAGLLSYYLAFLVALPARLLLGYELAVINLFAKIPFGFTVENFPGIIGALYYFIVIAFILYVRWRDQVTPLDFSGEQKRLTI